MDLKEGKIGANGSYDLAYENGKLLVKIGFDGEGYGANVGSYVTPRLFLDKLKAAIPGPVDDAVINALEAAFGL